MVSYSSEGKIAKFKIEFGSSHAIDSPGSSDFAMKSGKGRLIAVAGSDASILLQNLKKEMEAKTLPAKVQRAASVPFTFVIFGEHDSQVPGGGFRGNPPGHWTAAKLFLGEGENESEVFFNFNSVIRKAEFSMEDPGYGIFYSPNLPR
jgi:hypothetical protein